MIILCDMIVLTCDEDKFYRDKIKNLENKKALGIKPEGF